MGCDRKAVCGPNRKTHFNPRTPCGVRLEPRGVHMAGQNDFNPRTPCGVRHEDLFLTAQQREFQSTHPVWGATSVEPHKHRVLKFQSTHPVWGATTTARGTCQHFFEFQSTHPVWGATGDIAMRTIAVLFQSTHPVWGATAQMCATTRGPPDFNPRTPCGVRRGKSV